MTSSDLGWTTNDMLVGPTGDIYVDLYTARGNPPPGVVLLARPDGTVTTVVDDVLIPNGMATTLDQSTLILSETGTGRLLAFSINDDGTLRDRRVFADLGAERYPDGICLDAEGAVWVGSAWSHEFLRVRDGGEITHRIETPVGHWAVATAIGGPDGRTLFLVIDETTTEGMMRGDSRGRVETVRVDVPGAGWS